MGINYKQGIKSIVAWNHKKSWANYNELCKYAYLNWHHIPAPIWAIYTHAKTIWNTLSGKYRRCEAALKKDCRLGYYLGSMTDRVSIPTVRLGMQGNVMRERERGERHADKPTQRADGWEAASV